MIFYRIEKRQFSNLDDARGWAMKIAHLLPFVDIMTFSIDDKTGIISYDGTIRYQKTG
jgi:hypothetical protein